MKLKALLMAFMGIMSLSLAMTGCTADDESTEPSGAKYAYTKAELQEIADLQEEYGVELTDFTKESDEPLPTVDDMHELIAIVADMQFSLNHETSREEGRVVFSNENRKVRTHRMTPKRDMETYSGKKTGSGSLYYKDKELCGTYAFTIEWKDTDMTEQTGNITFSHEENSAGDWSLSYLYWSHNLEGAHYLSYRICYLASKSGNESFSAQVSISGGFSLDTK